MLERTLEAMIRAVRSEREAVRVRLGLPSGVPMVLEVREGIRLLAEPGVVVYRFTCELTVAIPEGTRVRVAAPGVASMGEITRHDPEDDELHCTVRDDLGPRLPHARLQLDSTRLLDLLEQRIAAVLEDRSRLNVDLALAFLSGSAEPPRSVRVVGKGLSEAQRRAVEGAVGARVFYLWGPPGTGKTRTVGALVRELVARGERVLLAAHTNVATDEALGRTLAVGSWPRGSVLRVGPPGPALARECVSLDELADAEIRERAPEVEAAIEGCVARARALGIDLGGARRAPLPRRLRALSDLVRAEERHSDTTTELASLERAVAAIERDVVGRASVVATTLTRLYTSEVLANLSVETAVVDEAGVAPLPLAFLAAGTASRRVVAAGDFMQLPAIVVAEDDVTRRWLGSSVFASAGCDDPRRDHPLRVLLDEQWRMHPRISALVSRHFYAGRLRDAPAVRERTEPRPAVVLVDSSRAGARSERASGSKRNPEHAAIVAALVACAVRTDVAVIAPYRAQVRLLRETIRRAAPGALDDGRVEVFTVHRFQGREKSLTIVDLVDAPGTRAGFLDDLRNPSVPNLVNVAISRARDRLVLLAHLEHLAELGRDNVLSAIMESIRRNGGMELEWGHEGDRNVLLRSLAD